MLFVIGLFVWWLIGYVGAIWTISKDSDIDAMELFFLFPLLGTGGPVTLLMVLLVDYGGTVMIRARNRGRW